jgi:hypothetical protein
MRRVSGIRFSSAQFLEDFEREIRYRYPHEEAAAIRQSYTVHRLNEGLVLEFRDMKDIEAFLETARIVGLAGRTFRIVKLVAVRPTSAFAEPRTARDLWAQSRIEEAGEAGRQSHSLIFTAAAYDRLRTEFDAARMDLEAYVA